MPHSSMTLILNLLQVDQSFLGKSLGLQEAWVRNFSSFLLLLDSGYNVGTNMVFLN